MLKPQIYGEYIKYYGKGVGLLEMAYLAGNTINLKGPTLTVWEEGSLTKLVKISGPIVVKGAGVDILFSLDAAEFSGTSRYVNINDQIVIPAEYMPDLPVGETLGILNEVLYNLVGIYDLKCLDTSIVDLKRVQKVPYSYECSGCVCLPLTDWQFANFSEDLVSATKVLKYFRIKERGLLVRTYGLDEETLRKNVNRFITEFK